MHAPQQFGRCQQAETYLPPDVCDSRWFARIRAVLRAAGVQVGDLTFISQGWVDSMQLTVDGGEVLVRAVETLEGKNAGLAESCELVYEKLEAFLPDVRKASNISMVDGGSQLRWGYTLDLVANPASARLLPMLTLRRRVTTGEYSRGADLERALASPHAPQSTAARLGSAEANLFFLLKRSTLRMPFLERSGLWPLPLATRFLVCSYEPEDVYGLRNS